jgi:hypothetical protein
MTEVTPEPLKAVKVFYVDPKWDLDNFHKANAMRSELFDICVGKAPYGSIYPPEVTEVCFKTRSLPARDQYRLGQVLKKYLNLDMRYWIETPASLTRTGNQVVAKTYDFPSCMCNSDGELVNTFGDGFDVYPYEIRFKLEHLQYIIRMGIRKEIEE